MLTISIKQPWAWAIMAGVKCVENRSWYTKHRGRIAIHASGRWDKSPRVREIFAAAGVEIPAELPTGVILGTVEITSLCSVEDCDGGPWAVGPWCWMLANPELFPRPIPHKGRLGLHHVRLPGETRTTQRAFPDCS